MSEKKPKKSGRPKGSKTTTVALERELTTEEIQFCSNFLNTDNQAEAYRMVWPDHVNPHTGASRLMKRPEIRDLLNTARRKRREKLADAVARSGLLSLELAEDRLTEVLTSRRRTRGEMLTRDTKELQIAGVDAEIVPNPSGKGRPTIKLTKTPEFESSLEEGAPVEDTDLLKAIDITFKRRMGYPSKPQDIPAPQTNFILYKPQWKMDRESKAPQQIEAGSSE